MPPGRKPAQSNLDKCALTRETPLEDKDSRCTVHMRLSEPVSVWKMDHKTIKSAALKMQSKRCDFAARQGENPHDGKAHLLLVECKRQVRGSDDEMERIRGQLAGGLNVLQSLAGGAGFPFDRLTPVLVSPNYTGGIGWELLLRFPIEYNNGFRARIKAEDNGVEIDDKFLAVKGARRKG